MNKQNRAFYYMKREINILIFFYSPILGGFRAGNRKILSNVRKWICCNFTESIQRIDKGNVKSKVLCSLQMSAQDFFMRDVLVNCFLYRHLWASGLEGRMNNWKLFNYVALYAKKNRIDVFQSETKCSRILPISRGGIRITNRNRIILKEYHCKNGEENC